MSPTVEQQVFPVLWQDDQVLLIDQNQLPNSYTLVAINRCDDMITAIKSRIVRGGPAIGIAAAYGVYLGSREIQTTDHMAFLERLEAIADQLRQTRVHKANLTWATEQMLQTARQSTSTVEQLRAELLAKAQQLQQENWATCQAIGKHGLSVLPAEPEKLSLYTHCNHGALATAGYGTSLGVVRAAWQQGRLAGIYAGETRPRLQGSRLTAWECVQEGIPVTIVTDSMAAHCMQQGLVQAVVVGADRIAANGDTLNKIGTYSLALLAKAHNLPFLVAAPLSTVDFAWAGGALETYEQQSPIELAQIGEAVVAPAGAEFYNPSSDLTPADLITAIVTERGAVSPTALADLQRSV